MYTAREACNFYVNNYKEAESKLARAWRQTILNLVGHRRFNTDIDLAFWPIKLQHSKEQGSKQHFSACMCYDRVCISHNCA